MLDEEDKEVINWFEEEHANNISLGDDDTEAKVILSEFGLTVLTHKDIREHMRNETDLGRSELEEYKKHLREESKL